MSIAQQLEHMELSKRALLWWRRISQTDRAREWMENDKDMPFKAFSMSTVCIRRAYQRRMSLIKEAASWPEKMTSTTSFVRK